MASCAMVITGTLCSDGCAMEGTGTSPSGGKDGKLPNDDDDFEDAGDNASYVS